MKLTVLALFALANVLSPQNDINKVLDNKGKEKLDSTSAKMEEYKFYESEGLRYLESGDLYKAFNYFIKGISLNNNSASCYYGLGRVLYEMDEYHVAMTDFQKALQFNKDKIFENELLFRIDACKNKIKQN